MSNQLYNICKMFGVVNYTDQHGNKTKYVFDYNTNECISEKEMTKRRKAKSDKKKGELLKEEFDKLKAEKQQGKLF